MTGVALGAVDAAPARPAEDSRLRVRVLFAAAFGALILPEYYVWSWSVIPADLRLHYLWRAVYWAGIDVAIWWLCVSIADATDKGNATDARPYALAAAAASAVAPWLHWITETWFFEPPIPPRTAIPSLVAWWQVSIVGAWRMTLLTAAYYLRLRSTADAAHLAQSQLDRAVLRRKAIESQLRALQGRIDPSLLFETLDDIERACQSDAARADGIIECLIAFLRRALPHTEEEDTSVAQEIALAEAYLALAQARNPGLVFEIDAENDAGQAAMVPMLLTPLVAHAIRATCSAETHVTVSSALDGGHVRIVIAVRAAEPDAVWHSSDFITEVAKRLDGVYASAASLAVGAAGTDSVQIVLRFPHEQRARSHR